MSVSASMLTLLQRVQPLETELRQVNSHTATIKSRLEKGFQLRKFDLIGSYRKGTAIRKASDVDFLAILARDDVRWGGKYVDSRTLLSRVRLWLSGLFQQTVMRRDQQALLIRFAGGAFAVDVVPGFFETMEDDGKVKFPVYSIPDGNGSWLQTSPGMHERCLRQADEQSGSMLARTIQLMNSTFPEFSFPVNLRESRACSFVSGSVQYHRFY